MTPREARYSLAASIRGALGQGWTVHAAPPESIQGKTVVIAPRSPYRQLGTVCQEEVRLELTVLVARGSSQAGLDMLDDVCSVVRQAVNGTTDPQAIVESISTIGIVQEVGGAEYLAAKLQVITYT
jgi:hypothetical protein